MPVIILALLSMIITSACLFHPLYPTELGLFASGWLVAVAALYMLWHGLKHKARTNDLLMMSMIFTLALSLCMAGLFDWLELALFSANTNTEGFYSGALLGAVVGSWVSYRVASQPLGYDEQGSSWFAGWAVGSQLLLGLYLIGNQSTSTEAFIAQYAALGLHLCLTALFCCSPKTQELTAFTRLMMRLLTIFSSLLVLIDLVDKQRQPMLWQIYGLLCIWLCYRSLRDHNWQYRGSFKTICLLALLLGLFSCWSVDVLATALHWPEMLSTVAGWSMAALVVLPHILLHVRRIDWQQLRNKATWAGCLHLPRVTAVADGIKLVTLFSCCTVMGLFSLAPMRDQPVVQSLSLFANLPGANRWLAALAMKDYHPFSSQVRFDLKTIAHAADSSEVVTQLRPAPDRFSYTENSTEYEASINGSHQGIGLRTSWRSDGLYLADVIPGSPADKAGFKRGDRITKVNGHSIDSNTRHASRFLKGSGVEQFTVARNNQQLECKVTPGQVQDRKPEYRFFEQQGQTIGYLRFDGFSTWLEPELKRFRKEATKHQVQRLVIDLRANGGGRLWMAADMTSWLIGKDHSSKTIFSYRYPLKYERRNTAITSTGSGNYPGAEKIAFITTDDTCSASESLINAVKVYRPVTLVGSRTCGKPWFMDTFQVGGETFSIISGEVLNARGESEPQQGMRPDIVMAEDLSVAAGSSRDPLLKAAVAAVL